MIFSFPCCYSVVDLEEFHVFHETPFCLKNNGNLSLTTPTTRLWWGTIKIFTHNYVCITLCCIFTTLSSAWFSLHWEKHLSLLLSFTILILKLLSIDAKVGSLAWSNYQRKISGNYHIIDITTIRVCFAAYFNVFWPR